jgi:peptidoglycan hydrolase-like protein with peptidoglycan-binding domain
MSFPTWVSRIGRFTVTRKDWGRTGYGYKGYAPRLVLHTTETIGLPDYASGANQPHLTIRLSSDGRDLTVWQHQSLNIGARALLGTSTNTANCIQVEQCMYSDGEIAKRVGGQWVGGLSATELATLGDFYRALADLCGIPARAYSGGRMSQSAWLAFSGVCEHAHVPQNSHWDCGVLDVIGALARAGAAAGSAVSKPSRGEARPKPGPATASKWDRHGLTYSEVKSVQKALNDHFGASLTVDGSYGPATLAAVKAAQRTLKVTADGIWGDATQAAYDRWKDAKRKPVKPSAPKLRNGSKGIAVIHLQAGLLRVFPTYAGPIKRTGGADGKFGDGTEQVVREFQRRSGLTPDGVVGPKTWAKLGRYHINP